MKRALLLVVVLLGVALSFSAISSAGPPPPCRLPSNVTPGAQSPDTTNEVKPPQEVGNAVTSTSGTWSFPCGEGSIYYDFFSGSTQVQNTTSDSYTIQSSDEGKIITVDVVGCDVNDDCANAYSTGESQVVGTSKLDDEFNGAANTKPSSSLWNFTTASPPGIAVSYNGSNSITETGAGAVEIQAALSGGTWYSGEMESASTYTGSRYVEARIKDLCNSNTGAEFQAFDNSMGSPNDALESDLDEQFSGSAANQDSYQFNLNHWNDGSEWHTDHWDSVNTGSAVCGVWHTYGEAVYSDHIDYYYDGTKVFTANKTDPAFSDLDGYQTSNDVAGDGDSPDAANSISNFTSYAQNFDLRISGHIDNYCGADTDGPDGDHDDSCSSDSDTASSDTDNDGLDGLYGTSPYQMYVDYVRVNSMS